MHANDRRNLLEAPRYKVRIGDDGRPKSSHADYAEAEAAAKLLAQTGWAGKAQIVDTLTGKRETIRAEAVR